MKLDATAIRPDPVEPPQRLHRAIDGPPGSPSPHRSSVARRDGRDVADVITFHARLFLLLSLGCIALISGLGLAVAHLAFVQEAELPRVVLRALLLDQEQNVPTFFSFTLMMLCSILLAIIIARALLAGQRFRLRWGLLAGLFFLGGFDEAARLHEKLNGPVRGALDTHGVLYFAWVVPVGFLVAVLAIVYLPFLRGLPAPIGLLFAFSGALYVGGAIGMELPGAAHFEAHGENNFTYHLLTTVEETLEMLGLTVFAYSLMRFLGHGHGSVRLAFRA